MDLTDVVAISYAHEDISFNEKVIGFANCLREKHGYNVIIDELLRQQETAIDFNEMMAKLISNANKVIVILTPKYKERADAFIGGVGYEYRIILNEISTNPKKFIFVTFDAIDDDLIHRIEPEALGNREVIALSEDDEKWDELFSKLADKPIYQFLDVAPIKSEPKSKIVEFTKSKNKAGLFRFAQIKLAENRQLLEQFGPDSIVAINNPMSSAVNTWKIVKLNTIIPNNREIVCEFEKCISLLSDKEVEIYKKFKIHADAFEIYTKGEIEREGVPRFPSDFEKMISEGVKMPDQFVKFPRRESIAFFEKAMNSHSRVNGWDCLSDSYYEIYRDDLPTIKVFVANYYALSVSDYYDIASDYAIDCLITISKWNSVTQDAYELGKRNGVGVFTMEEFLGALNYARPCTYIRPIDREDNDRNCSGFGKFH